MTHTCHADGCTKPVPPKMFMCKRHWYAVPKPLRDAIWATYRQGQEHDKAPSDNYLRNASEAVKSVAAKEGREISITSYDVALKLREKQRSGEGGYTLPPRV